MDTAITASTSPLTPIITPILQALATALAAALVALVVKALKRINISIDAEQQAKLEYVAKQQVLKVEEEAANKYMPQVATATAKLEAATAGIIAKMPNVTPEEAKDAVHAALPQVGLGATVLLTKVGEAVVTRP